MSIKRKNEDFVAYVHNVSPKKSGNFFSLRLQTPESKNKTVKAMCFDVEKREKLVSAQISGDAVKFKNIVKQNETAKNYFAQYVTNKNTDIAHIEKLNVPFERAEPAVEYVELDLCNHDVGKTVSVKATLDLSNAVEKEVRVGLRYTKVLNQACLVNDTGSVEFTIWEEWISFFRESVVSGNHYFNFINLLVRSFSGEKYLSTCSDTECYAIMDETPPNVQVPIQSNTVVTLPEFDSIHAIDYGYICGACKKLIKIKSMEEKILKCENCGVVSRSSVLEGSMGIVVKADVLGDQLYKIDVSELSRYTGVVGFDTDKAELTQMLMEIRDLTVELDTRHNRLTVI